MKPSAFGVGRIVLGLLGVLLVAAMVNVVKRSGPLAPIRFTVVQSAEGRFAPALFGIGTVEARHSCLIGDRALDVVRILEPTAVQAHTAIILVTHDEKIVPTFKRVHHIRHGGTHEETGEGRSL